MAESNQTKPKIHHRVKHKVKKVKQLLVDKNFPGRQYYLPIFVFSMVSAVAALSFIVLVVYRNYQDWSMNKNFVPYNFVLKDSGQETVPLEQFEETAEYEDMLAERFSENNYLVNVLLTGLEPLASGSYSLQFVLEDETEFAGADFTYDNLNGIINETNQATNLFFVNDLPVSEVAGANIYLQTDEGNRVLIAVGELEAGVGDEEPADNDEFFPPLNFNVMAEETATEYSLNPNGIIVVTR